MWDSEDDDGTENGHGGSRHRRPALVRQPIPRINLPPLDVIIGRFPKQVSFSYVVDTINQACGIKSDSYSKQLPTVETAYCWSEILSALKAAGFELCGSAPKSGYIRL